ncbi:MAG: Dabb family protein [Bacteroidales bacterium]|nr:Dabb family protein [Bacteroidales bacterium]
MLRHIVMMRFEEHLSKVSAGEKVKGMLLDLLKTVEPLKKMEVGLNTSTSPSAFDLVLTADFDDEAGLNAYRVHPDHVKILDWMKKNVSQVTVVDYFM